MVDDDDNVSNIQRERVQVVGARINSKTSSLVYYLFFYFTNNSSRTKITYGTTCGSVCVLLRIDSLPLSSH